MAVHIKNGGQAVGDVQDKAEQAHQNNAIIEDALCDMDEILNGGAAE